MEGKNLAVCECARDVTLSNLGRREATEIDCAAILETRGLQIKGPAPASESTEELPHFPTQPLGVGTIPSFLGAYYLALQKSCACLYTGVSTVLSF